MNIEKRQEIERKAVRHLIRSRLTAAEHSLRKWKEGLDPKTLRDHGVERHRDKLVNEGAGPRAHGGDMTWVDGDSCALCHYSQRLADAKEAKDGLFRDQCDFCPIMKINGRSCDDNSDGFTSPWTSFAKHGLRQPMILLLERVVKHLKEASPAR